MALMKVKELLLTRNRTDKMLDTIAKVYETQYMHHGPSPTGVLWKSQQQMDLRFEILSEIFLPEDVAQGRVDITDYGCGYGALFDYLAGHRAMQYGHYRGYDICDAMIAGARMRIQDNRARFIAGACLHERADYILLSGTLNLKLDKDEALWQEYLYHTLVSLWQKTNKGFAFNLLDDRTADKQSGLYYARLPAIVDFCQNTLCRDGGRVQVLDKYGSVDFTLHLWK